MWTAAILSGSRTLPTLSSLRTSFPPMYAPRISASLALLAKKLVFLCPYLPSSQPVYLSTPTTSVDGPSLTFGAPSPTHLPVAFPSMSITFKSTIPFWISLGLSSIIILATFYYLASRTRPTDTHAVHRAKRVQIPNKSENPVTKISQTCIFTLGLITGVALGLGIHSTPIPLIISALTQNFIDLTADAVVQISHKLRSFLWCKAQMLHVKAMVEPLYNRSGQADSRYLSRTYATVDVEPSNVELSLWAINLTITLGLFLVFNLLAQFLPVMSVHQASAYTNGSIIVVLTDLFLVLAYLWPGKSCQGSMAHRVAFPCWS
ncbi:hypothetical protein PILCRDRAFT_405209 [Piloderma croceum F 1598]|uniref:Uncharacterized protein n=1 Tax=Piloderma croceum (strain F 1598) TaxID=765440 RepID=A0A0C3C3R5_PILCF|nr:hypothetical protein PILCRDRAFT_405209 [Piloderma croceum F 1598]